MQKIFNMQKICRKILKYVNNTYILILDHKEQKPNFPLGWTIRKFNVLCLLESKLMRIFCHAVEISIIDFCL